MRERRLGVSVFLLLVAMQAVLIAVIADGVPDVARAWKAFPISGLRDGVRVDQTFDIGHHGLAGIDLAGSMAASRVARYVDVRLAGPEGTSAVTRRATITVAPGQTTCCHFAFERIPVSGRRYQLELRFRGFTDDHNLSLDTNRVRVLGGLSLNGRTLPANLAMTADGDIERLPGALRVPLTAFAAAILAIDLLVALAAQWLASARTSAA
jgi:hypothetical protein